MSGPIIKIPDFTSEDGINDFKAMSDDEIKEFVGIVEIYKSYPKDTDISPLLPDGDIYALMEQAREDNFIEYRQLTNWCFGITRVLDNNGIIKSYSSLTAWFIFINKWDQEGYEQKYRIIVDDNMKILWIGHDNGQYFISVEKRIYSIEYRSRELWLFPNISSENEYFNLNNRNKKNDYLVKKYRKNMKTYKGIGTTDNAQEIFEKEKVGIFISMEKHFEKDFFYKGLKWNPNWKNRLYYDMIILIGIHVENNIFCIEVENITYPFYGYVLFDLNEIKIIEAKKMVIKI